MLSQQQPAFPTSREHQRLTKHAALKAIAHRNGFFWTFCNLPRLFKGYAPLFIDYPVHPLPRYGYGLPPHARLQAMFSAEIPAYRNLLIGFLRYEAPLRRIPICAPASSLEPCWINKWFSGIDTVALYGIVASTVPALCVEVGSGQSTKVIRRAITDHHLKTKLVSIDPCPRAEIDSLCDAVLRMPLETLDLSCFEELRQGDILFVDGSHRCFMNSDVTVLFLDILPMLAPGVLVHLHDIYLPLDYPPERAGWYYSEQYLLAASLLGGHAGYDIVLPNTFVTLTPDLRGIFDPFWNLPEMTNVHRGGGSFWIKTRADHQGDAHVLRTRVQSQNEGAPGPDFRTWDSKNLSY